MIAQGLWSRTLGRGTTWVVDGMIAALCLACCIIYSAILGDIFTSLLEQFGPILVAAQFNHRMTNVVAITVTLLLPMSLLKNLSALAFTSLLGFGSILYTVVFITIRAMDGTYQLGTGRFAEDGVVVDLPPSLSPSKWWKMDVASLVLISTYGLAYVAHYNAPTFYRELTDTNSQRFTVVVSASYAILMVLYAVTMVAGYSTFGDHCHGNILLNYHPSDGLATLGRLATGFSILFGFPLVVTGAREGLVSCLGSLGFAGWGSDKNHVVLVVIILTFVTVVACTVKDVSLVVGVTGATMGSAIVYICPALLYTRAVRLVKGADSIEYRAARWNLALVPFGVAIAALGVYMMVKESSLG
jgi:amino acid permease